MADRFPPRTVHEATRLLMATWNVPGNPIAAPDTLEDPATVDPWTALTRQPVIPRAAGAVETTRQRCLQQGGPAYGLPPVLVRLPLEYLTTRGVRGWSEMGGDPMAVVLAEDGYPGWGFTVGTPVRPAGRMRWAVVGGDVAHLPAEPFTTHALAVGSLAATRASELVQEWSWNVGSANDGRRARGEAGMYAEVAAELEAAIPASAAWAEDLHTWTDWPSTTPERTGSSWL